MIKNKKNWGFWTTLVLIQLPFVLFAQKITYVDTSFSIFVPKTIYGEIDVNTCVDSLIEQDPLQFSYDVLINSEGEMYGYGPLNGFIFDTIFYLSLDEPGTMYWPPNSTTISHDIRGLTCDENGLVYSAGKGISRRNTECCKEQQACCDKWKEIYLGTLPPDMQCLGDITYRKGKFYLSAIGNKLVEVNMKDISKSQIIYEFPPGTLPIHGLTTVQVGCDSVITYAVGKALNHSIVYELDFDTWTLTQKCDMPLLAIEGAANKTECALPPCDFFIDLDNDNSSFAFWGNYCADSFCLPPIAVADTDVVVLSMANTLDSMLLELTGIQNGALEFLETNLPAGNLTILGNGTSSLLFINNGVATIADFEAALKSAVYQNTAVPLAYGMRHVRVTGWSGGVASIVSTADLPLSNNVLHTTAIATMPSCFGLSDGNLAVQVNGGTMPYTYLWQQGSTDSLLAAIGAGNYQLTVSDAVGCTKADIYLLDQPAALVASITNLGLPTICDNSGSLVGSAIGGTSPYSFNWDNGALDSANANIGPGMYELTAVDSNGCTDNISYTILAGDSVLIQSTVTICDGETFIFNDSSYTSDTTVCQVFMLANGCDSTVCVSLMVNPSPLLQITASGTLCNGQSVMLNAGQFEAYEWSTGATSQSISTASAGDYSVTVSNAFACTATANYSVVPSIAFDFQVQQPSCFGLDDGSINITSQTGGTAPYLYSIDSINYAPSNTFTGLAGGNYWPSVKDASGCKVVEAVVLDNPQAIVLNLGADQTTQLGVPVHFTATTNLPNLNILWEPADFLDCATCLDVMASPPYSITYTVTASDANGCEAVGNVSVFIDSTLVEHKYFIPNAFSPNGDGFNDNFTVFSDASILNIASLEIFDRWGEKLYYARDIPTSDTEKGWNGDFKNKPMPSGIYVFVAKLVTVDGKTETVKGEVNLLR